MNELPKRVEIVPEFLNNGHLSVTKRKNVTKPESATQRQSHRIPVETQQQLLLGSGGLLFVS